jgi:hypothetical protein
LLDKLEKLSSQIVVDNEVCADRPAFSAANSIKSAAFVAANAMVFARAINVGIRMFRISGVLFDKFTSVEGFLLYVLDQAANSIE